MENNTNILSPLVDSLFEVGKTLIKVITKNNSFDFRKYFEDVQLYTKTEKEKIKPRLISKSQTEKGEKYIFSIPPGYGSESLNKYKDGMESAIGSKLEFKYEGKNWIIEILKNKLKDNLPYEVPTRSKEGIIIPIGESLTNTVEINLKENPNSFIVGTTGSGKSVCVKSIITSIVNLYTSKEVELYLCDLKRVELNLFRNLEHTKEFVYKVEDVTQTILDTLEECENRYDLFMKRNVTSIFEYNKLTRNKLPFRILFIEEIVLLLQDKKHIGMNALKQLLSICRASGIYVFISTQRPSSDVIDNVVKANINNRICFKVEDSKNSIICLDDVGAEDLKGKGHGIIKIGANKTEFQGYFISDQQTKDLIKNFISKDTVKSTSKQLGFKENKLEVVEDLSFLDKL